MQMCFVFIGVFLTGGKNNSILLKLKEKNFKNYFIAPLPSSYLSNADFNFIFSVSNSFDMIFFNDMLITVMMF